MRRSSISVIIILALIAVVSAATATAAPELTLAPTLLELCNKDASAQAWLTQLTNPHNSSLTNLTLWLETDSTAVLWEGDTAFYAGDLAPGQTIVDHSWELLCDESKPGSHIVAIRYSAELDSSPINGDALISGENASVQVIITPAPPLVTSFTVSGISPHGEPPSTLIYRSTENTVEFRIETDELSLCRLGTSDLPFVELPTPMTTDGIEHTKTLSFEEGVHTLYARCMDIQNNEMESPAKLALIVDISAPSIIVNRPSTWEPGTTVPIKVTTNEQGECRYSHILESHEGMTALNSNGLEHTGTLTLAEGVYSLYISCVDLAGNSGRSVKTVTVDISPTATITAGDGPLKPGLYRINLTSSESLLTTPTLSYLLSGTTETRFVSLEGSGTSWSGYMLLPDTGGEHVGTFSFKGTNANGRAGSEILSGKLFIVDAKSPEPPTGLDAGISSGSGNSSLMLVWRHASESVERFNVYGSSSPFVGYADFLTTVYGKRYTQNIPGEGIFYFRITAIDDSGNEGELSEELTVRLSATGNGWAVQSWIPGESDATQSVGPILPQSNPETTLTLTSLIQEVSSLLLDVRAAKDLIIDDESESMASLGLTPQLNDAISELVTMEDELDSLSMSGTTSPDQLRLFNLRIARLRKTTPKTATVLDKLSIEHSIQQEELNQLIRETLLTPNRNAAALTITAAAIGVPSGSSEAQEAFEQKYLGALAQLHGQLRVTRTTESFEIEYHDGSTESKTLLVDEITGIDVLSAPEEGTENMLPEGIEPQVFISLPKSVTSDASDIEFITEDYEIVEQDPVIAFPFTTRKIEMLLPGKVSESKARQISTFLAYEPEQFSRAVSDSGMEWDTGSGLLSGLSLKGIGLEGIILFLGVAMILGMAGYYVYLRKGQVLQGSIMERIPQRKPRYEEPDIDLRQHFSQTASTFRGKTSGEQIENSLKELERLSSELEPDDDLTHEDMEKLHDLEMVKALIKEAEEAKGTKDIEMVRMLYRDLGHRYGKLSAGHKELVSERCITLHNWLRQNTHTINTQNTIKR